MAMIKFRTGHILRYLIMASWSLIDECHLSLTPAHIYLCFLLHYLSYWLSILKIINWTDVDNCHMYIRRMVPSFVGETSPYPHYALLLFLVLNRGSNPAGLWPGSSQTDAFINNIYFIKPSFYKYKTSI